MHDTALRGNRPPWKDWRHERADRDRGGAAKGSSPRSNRSLTEDVPLERALGRVLAEDVSAPADVPPFDSSAMDGFARGRAGGRAAGGGRVARRAPLAGWSARAWRCASPRARRCPRAPTRWCRSSATEEAGERVRGARARARAQHPPGGRGHARRRARCSRRRRPRAGRAGGGGRAGPRPPRSCARAPAGGPRGDRRRAGAPRRAARPGPDLQLERARAGRPGGRGRARSWCSPRACATPRGHARRARARRSTAADVVCVSGGVSVGPHDHVQHRARATLGVEERFWGVALKPGKPTWFGARDGTLVFGLPGNPVSAMVTSSCSCGRRCAALQGADPGRRTDHGRAGEAVARNPRRDQAVRVRLSGDGRLRRDAHGPQGSHLLTSMLGADGARADPRRGGRAGRRRGRGRGAPVRRRDPRRLLERHQRARAHACRSSTCPRSDYAADGSIGSRQVAEVSLPRSELDRIWSAEYLERLAPPTGASSRASRSGCCGCDYTDDAREIVLLTRPFVLLRFRSRSTRSRPTAARSTWRIDKGLLVAPAGRGQAATCASPCAPRGRRRHERRTPHPISLRGR